MIPPPVVLGLTICEKAIVEEGTKNVTLVNTFTRLVVEKVPSPPQRFSVYTVLTDGLGDATMQLTVTNLETDKEVYRLERRVHFPDRLAEVRLLFRIGDLSFPESGVYQTLYPIPGRSLAGAAKNARCRKAGRNMNEQNNHSHNGGQGAPDSSNAIIIVVDGPGDTTHRSRPPQRPLHPPDRRPPNEQPPDAPPTPGNS